MFQRVPDAFWFADHFILSWCFDACGYQHDLISFFPVIYSHRLACMFWKAMIAARRCVATLVMLSRRERKNMSNDFVPLFYNRCEH